MLGWILAAGVLAVALAQFLVWTARQPTTAVLDGWAARHGVDLDEPPAREMARGQLRRGRLARTFGFGVALSIGLVSMYLTHEPVHDPAWYLTNQQYRSPPWISILASPAVWVAGYLLGALAGELTRPSANSLRLRGASLSPRQLGGYLPTGILAAERCLAVAVIALTPLAASARAAGPELPQPLRTGIPNGVVALAVAALLEVGLRLIVHRAQPVASTVELAIDDAFRTTTVHRALAAALAVQLFLLGEQGATAVFLVPWLAGASWFAAAACFGLALRSWSAQELPGR